MKNMFIAAAIAGVALAGAILYFIKTDTTTGLLVDKNGTPLLH